MPHLKSKARTLFAGLLCAAAVSISAPALAGSHNAYVKTINERATTLGCALINTNRDFETMKSALEIAG